MNVKPRSTDNAARCEEIRAKLGVSQAEFSRMIGFATEGGYHASISKNSTTNQLALAAEGLLARHRPNKELRKKSHFLLSLQEDGETEVRPISLDRTLVLDGQAYSLIELITP